MTLTYLLFTHSHEDHLSAGELEYLISPHAKPALIDSIKILGNRNCIDIIKRAINSPLAETPGLMNIATSFKQFDFSPYKVTTLKAKHKPDEEALNYIIEKEGKRFLYTCDTGYYEPSSWNFLKSKKVDLVISECTEGPNNSDYKYHMGFPNVLEFKKKAEEIGLTDNDTPWVLTHFSHNGGLMHHELEELVRPEGFKVAWDGMEIEI